MNREIKFRAYAHASKVMFYPDDDGLVIAKGRIDSPPNTTLMQFTGLKDKNDKEIYEGDILERKGTRDIFQGSADDIPGANPHTTERIVVSLVVTKTSFGFSLNPERSYSERGNPATYEIIGNIYENPELIPQQVKS